MKKWFLIFFLLAVIQFAGCASPEQANPENAASELQPEAVCRMTTPVKTSSGEAQENFENDRKNSRDAALAELERNQLLWQESKTLNYNFVCAQIAGGFENPAEPAIIKVRTGKAVSIEPVTKSNAPKLNGYQNFDTIDKLFEYARLELENGKILSVKYNKKLGYPEITSVKNSYAIDDWNSINITKFEVVK